MRTRYKIWLPALALLVASCQKDEATEPAAPVTAAFTMPAKVPLATAVSFQNQSQNATKYTWSFGDGGTSLDKSPTHTYATAGQYAVRLQASATTGSDSASIRQLITIEDTTTVKAAFSAPAEAARATAIAFQNQSRGATSYSWTFGDGSGSQEKNPTHVYASAGTYQVNLRALSSSKVDSVVKPIVIR